MRDNIYLGNYESRNMLKFWLANWKDIVAVAGLIWSAFCFVYILYGLPSRVQNLEQWVKGYEMERLPPRVISLESDVKGFEKEIYIIKADLQENYRITINTYDLVKEMRDEIIRESIRSGHAK